MCRCASMFSELERYGFPGSLILTLFSLSYTKTGQKFPTPTPGFGDRVFYETLLRQRPESAMAQEW